LKGTHIKSFYVCESETGVGIKKELRRNKVEARWELEAGRNESMVAWA
jgi:hypothetical protein